MKVVHKKTTNRFIGKVIAICRLLKTKHYFLVTRGTVNGCYPDDEDLKNYEHSVTVCYITKMCKKIRKIQDTNQL